MRQKSSDIKGGHDTDEKVEQKVQFDFSRFNKIVQRLDERNLYLERENKKLEKNLNKLKSQKDNTQKGKGPISTGFLKLTASSKRKQQEYEEMSNELDKRRIMLDTLEAQLNKEKQNIMKQKNDFLEWREKLEFLEDEVEKRRCELVANEKMFVDQINSATENKTGEQLFTVKKGEVDGDYHDMLDKIPGNAAVIQRGVLKQVNLSFAELLGYDIEEIVGKSLFDFITPDGFIEIERYYLDRLKGIDNSGYTAILLTKDNEKVTVEVNTRPTIFNGIKAEIAVFSKNP